MLLPLLCDNSYNQIKNKYLYCAQIVTQPFPHFLISYFEGKFNM